jgi:alpha-beta hydrolase superfamily lysophospholipase
MSAYFPDPRGTRLHYQYWEDSAKGYDRLAIVLHGLGLHSGAYPALVPALVGARRKVVAPDFAGFGASPGERGAGGVLAMADAVEFLCRRVEAADGAKEIEIVAHSMGAIAALLFLQRYPARSARLVAVSPLLLGAPASASPDALAEAEAHRRRIAEDPRCSASVPAALAADLDRVAKELLAEPSFLEGRSASFLVGEADPFVHHGRLKSAISALPLKERRFASIPRERHDPLGGDRGDQAISAILSWLDETRFE